MKNSQKRNKKGETSEKPIVWNLGLLYKSPEDPKIIEDLSKLESLNDAFAEKFDVPDKKYLTDDDALFEVLTDYEKLTLAKSSFRVMTYFACLNDIDAKSSIAISKISIFGERLTKSENKLLFFAIALGSIAEDRQKKILENKRFSSYKVLLQRIFNDAKYWLSVPEEKIMELKGLPAYDMWVMAGQRTLNVLSVDWKRQSIPLPKAFAIIPSLQKSSDRKKLSKAVNEALKSVASFAESEMNAVVTNKKIDDDLRGYSTAYQSTVVRYRNDPAVVENLINVVSNNFSITHRFYRLKAKLLKQKKLSYCDRAAEIGSLKKKFSFDQSFEILKKVFGSLNPVFEKTLIDYVKNGQIDTHPRVGKKGGAYCRSSYFEPTYILLNHNDDVRSFTTFAHEMGHAFHTLLSRKQDPIYADYSTSLAETASTLFESIASEAVYETLTDKEKIIVLHDKIGDDISTIFRQVACFNFEKEIHETIRAQGYVSKEVLADMHNRHMKAYLGPVFEMDHDDGYMFVQWSHIRRFFYVYSYAYGMLVSKALLRKYKADKKFWSSIEKFLSAGEKQSPENILKEIGIDVTKPDFWLEGIKEIEDDLVKLEKLVSRG